MTYDTHYSAPPTWSTDEGRPIACLEKIKVLNENYAELRQIAQDALEDALLMGCSEAQVRAALHALVDELHNPYEAARHEACRRG
jgi:hypothetical protein